jgi:hypothetical protein
VVLAPTIALDYHLGVTVMLLASSVSKPLRLCGSSRITGKDALDLHEKKFAVPVTVRHPFDDLDSIVDAFQLARMHRPANTADDAPPVTVQSFGKLDQSRYVAFMRMA